MFNFLKNLFVKETPKEEIKTENLSSWFNSKTNILLHSLDNDIENILEKIKEEKEKTNSNLEILKNAQLQNPNIPFKAKQLMEGNREAYIRKVIMFLKQIELEKDHKKLYNFCLSFDSLLDNFGKSTLKPYHILQEFFANESKSVANNIKNFDNLIKELRIIIEEKNLKKIEEIKEKINNLQIQINQKNKLSEELNNLSNLNKEIVYSKQFIEKDIEKLKIAEEYSNLKNLKQTKQNIENEFNNNKSLLDNSFSIIEMALKKYARIAFEYEILINDYLQNPIETLLNDKELRIINILEKLNNNIINNKIELKERKKEKTLEEIKNLNLEFFNNFIKRHNELRNRLDNVNKRINENKTRKILEEYKNRLNKIDEDTEKTEQKIDNLKKEIEKINIEEMKRELEKEINGLLKTNIILLF